MDPLVSWLAIMYYLDYSFLKGHEVESTLVTGWSNRRLVLVPGIPANIYVVPTRLLGAAAKAQQQKDK